ncbi:N-acetylmuramoyl-L-alanine amidase [Ruaniaceae bacterium KH17]|nr:N-acetylmuramoyl-L-alanine amidase [Ruaniaceae bacterium KH17]
MLLALAIGGFGLWLGQTPSFADYGRGVAAIPRPEPAPIPEPEPEPEPLTLEGFVIALDAGHNSQNAANPQVINALVPDGRGRMKACNTVGTMTANGYAEYEFTWDVVDRMRALLDAEGATVRLTHEGDGVGPCVDERGQFPQTHGADVMVSVHGNGSENPAQQGYFAILSEPPLNEAQGQPSRALAASLMAALAAEGFTQSSAFEGGVMLNSEQGTLNHSERPVVIMELAEFHNPEEAEAVQDPEVRQRYADALAAGLTDWLLAQ